MEPKEKLIENLEKCKSSIEEAMNLHKELVQNEIDLKKYERLIKENKEGVELAKRWKKRVEEGDYFKDYSGDFLESLKAKGRIALIIIASLWVLTIMLYLLSVDAYKLPFAILTNIIFYIFVLLIVCGLSVVYSIRHNSASEENMNEHLAYAEHSIENAINEYQDSMEKYTNAKIAFESNTSKLQANMQSDIGILAQKLIPPDYFYPAAIEKFIYFLRNGHVDNMKEAVKEYDEYIHRITMEYEAQLQRENSEKAAAYAKATAAAASDMAMAAAVNVNQIAKMSREIQEKQDSIQFWTLYNGTLLEDIKNGK